MITPETSAAPVRGRPRAAELANRKQGLLDVAADLVVRRQPDGLTVEALAVSARTSKTTVYSWFGGLDGVYAALVSRQAARVLAGWDTTVPRTSEDLRSRLAQVAGRLLDMLTDEVSVALHRMAMRHPDVARVVLARGRHEIGPLVEAMLEGAASRSVIAVPDAAVAFETFYGLVVGDRQIRVLLGERRPGITEREAWAGRAVDQFLELHRMPGG